MAGWQRARPRKFARGSVETQRNGERLFRQKKQQPSPAWTTFSDTNNLFCSSTTPLRPNLVHSGGPSPAFRPRDKDFVALSISFSAIMSNRKDMRRPDLSQLGTNESSYGKHADLHPVVPYVEPQQEKSDADVACTKKSQLPSQTTRADRH